MSDEVTRRRFLRTTSAVTAGTLAGALPGRADAAQPPQAGAPRILNHNPRMRYRRLGKTNLMVSEISLGGHWATRGSGRGCWMSFARNEVPDDVARNRTEVVARSIDAGINYLDITTPAECLAYGVALRGRRDRMYVGADDTYLCPRHRPNRNVDGQMRNIDSCLQKLRTDYLDIWRPQFRQDGEHPDSEVEPCVAAFERARQQGKVRWLGMSSHNRQFIQRLIERFPAFSMVIFPYTARSRVQPRDIRSIDPSQIVERGTGDGAYSGDVRRSIFDLVQPRDIGVVTIKPFAGGALFRSRVRFGASMTSTEADYERARLTLAYILCNPRISATVPGMTTVEQVDNNVRASAERHALLGPDGLRRLHAATDRMWANLPEEYEWLHEWEWV